MSNYSQEQNKIVKNPLFSASVTGSTFEEFSQNALLLPAPKPSTPSPVPTSQQSNLHPPLRYFSSARYNNSEKYILSNGDPEQITDAFSSFSDPGIQPNSNQLTGNATELIAYSQISNIPANIQEHTSITSPLQNPLVYNPNQQIISPISSKPGIPQGSVNNYRRTNKKRPVYAPIPGLSSGHSPLISSSDTVTTCTPITDIQTSLLPNVNISGQWSKWTASSLTVSLLLSQFQEITFDEAVAEIKSPLNEITYFRPELTTAPLEMPLDDLANGSSISTNPLLQQPPIQAFTSINDTHTEAFNSSVNSMFYRPVYHHWFHKQQVEGRIIWDPFSMSDSLALESAFTSAELLPDKLVATDGGRYDVNILRRERNAVYWKSAPTEVRRCSWFYKEVNGRYIPYEENISTQLEEEFKTAFESMQWPRKVELSANETIIMHSPDVLVLLPPTQPDDAWPTTNQTSTRPKVVKRGMDEFEIDEGEPPEIDHLLFMVHGIGSKCDLNFRTVEEVVNEFRSTALQLVKSHYRTSCERGLVHRIEVLPIRWHDQLHSEDTGIDKKLKSITLKSVPYLRNFANDTLLDVLFYSSPIYCQTIIGAVGGDLNRIYDLFKSRNPRFQGSVSLGGHSLGSLILFDLLCHQTPGTELDDNIPEDDELLPAPSTKKPAPLQRRMSKKINYTMGAIGTGQPDLHYPHLSFRPIAFFALGSPIGMFVTVRGLEALGKDFVLPTCSSFYNIFHPFDPVAYRIESLVNPELSNVRPVLIPHHKGRKRMHLELKETVARVGADLKAKILDSMRSTWNSFYQLAMFHSTDNETLEEQMEKVVEDQMEHVGKQQMRERTISSQSASDEEADSGLFCGRLNQGKRIDYVLQEAPLETINQYIFSVGSHLCYWRSEDTTLFILKVLYNSSNITTDNKIPQQTMSIERVPQQISSISYDSNDSPTISPTGMDPTIPIHENVRIGPPPTTGFMRKME